MGGRTIVAVVDDDKSVRKSLVRLLTSSETEVWAFASATEFLASSECDVVSCVISDLRMPELSGQQLQEELRNKFPALSMIFITGYGDVPTTVTAMRAGAIDFLEKPIKSSVLLDAIRRAVNRSNAVRAATAGIEKLKINYGSLTPREREVLALVSAGLLNKQIAAELGAAEKTIKQHRGAVMRKMQAESLAALVLMAERLGVRPNTDFAAARGKSSS